MKLRIGTSAIKEVDKENGNGSEQLQVDDKLVKFFEILMQIDQRQKRNGKNN